MKSKFDATTILGLVATGLGLAGTLLSQVVGKKQMDAKIAEEVKKAIENK